MEVIVVLLPLALMLGALFVVGFLWSTFKGQYDDLETPRFRILLEDKKITQNISTSKDDK